jgi:hypothetical protein
VAQVVIAHIVRDRLVVPRQLAGADIQRHDRVGVEVLAWAVLVEAVEGGVRVGDGLPVFQPPALRRLSGKRGCKDLDRLDGAREPLGSVRRHRRCDAA